MTVPAKFPQNNQGSNADLVVENDYPCSGAEHLDFVAKNCIECTTCVQECGFLQQYGTPGKIAKQYLSGDESHLTTAFSCSLCGMCTSVCPQDLPVRDMFLLLRQAAVRKGKGRFKGHRGLLFYEKLGSSYPFMSYSLPDHCTTVFFPGCTLPGIRPEQTLELFHALQENIPNLGFVFDCCNKPSHDLGFQKKFLEQFGKKIANLRGYGVTKIITACPSCFQSFKKYGGDIEVSTVYTHLLRNKSQSEKNSGKQLLYTMHDPCTVRFEPEIQQAVRELAQAKGVGIAEMTHNREITLCCGEGGAAHSFSGGGAADWKGKRLAEAGELTLLTYCAGCTVTLASDRTIHLLDLLFPGQSKAFKVAKVVRSPFTYFNRLCLKRKISKYFRKSNFSR